MDDELLYLRPDVQVEPLVDQWYAWTHLLAPATAARNLTHRYFRILESYLSAPQMHASAVKNPKMLGGPFVDHGGQRLDEVRALWERTRQRRAPLIELSEALEGLDELLRTQATGHSLHPLYALVPDALRGFVELVYDLRHNATFRLIEPLLYGSRYCDTSSQSLMLSITAGDDRPFVMSTPRLEEPGAVHLRWAFDDERVDDLFRLKRSPRAWNWIQSRFDVPASEQEQFRSFFTTDGPPPYHPHRGDRVRWRYFGHACILVERGNVAILVDPVLSYTYESTISRYTYADLPEFIDVVLITHNHWDHILLETLLQIRHKTGLVVVPRSSGGALQDPSLKLALERIGFRHVRELSELESIDAGDAQILGVPFLGEHADLAVPTKLAYVVTLGSERLMFAADSCNVEPRLYEQLRAQIGPVDTLFLGMECDGAPMSWLYGPLLLRRIERGMDQSRRLSGSDYEKAIAVVEQLGCRAVYVYAMGQEPWLNYIMSIKYTQESRPIVESTKLVNECLARGLVAERLFGEREIIFEDVSVVPAGGA